MCSRRHAEFFVQRIIRGHVIGVLAPFGKSFIDRDSAVFAHVTSFGRDLSLDRCHAGW